MSVELISVLIAVLAVGVTLVGVILTSNRGLRQDMRLLATVALLAAGCTPNQPIQEPTIPDDVSYSIIDSTAIAGIKRSLDVRLNKRVSEDTLHAIALKLKSQDSLAYDRTFITYYLPGMTVGAGAWATTHFTPDLEVKILGLSIEEEKKLSTAPAPAKREIVGWWLDEIPYASSRITIFHEGGKLYVERVFTDGSSLKEELVEKRSPLGRRFDQGEVGTAGDHWIIDSRGNLQLHDNDGLITTLRKIAARKAREQERVKRTVEERAESSPGVISDRFELHWELDGTDLLLAIDTDLPDEGELSVSVSRTYYKVGSDVFYHRDYFSEFEPVSRWREPRRIALDADAWKADLTAHQNQMAALGNDFAFEVARIEDSIKIRAVLHMNQDDPRFGGHGNPNLSGEATSRSGNRILVEAEASIPFPL